MAPRTRLFATAVAALCAAALATLPAIAGAHAAPGVAPSIARTAFADPPTGSSVVSNLGATNGWKVLTSATATQGGATISTPGFSTSGWLTVANDGGGAPGTEVAALLQNGTCPNVYFSTNMKTCFGQMTKVGADTIAQFSVPWWYRTDFAAPPSGQNARLILNGVIGSADVWVNGSQVASSSNITGAYVRNVFDITSLLRSGTNSLAIEVHPNDPTKMLTLDNVDWSQIPPDNNTGIQFPVQLQAGGPLVVGNAHVNQNTSADLSSSALTVKTDVTNTTSSSQTGTVTATVTPPGGGSPITVSQNVTVAANATTTVSFTPATSPGLTLSHPQIWWPYQLGAQPLYTLTTSVAQGGSTLASTNETFGIRTVTSTLVGAGSAAPDGVRQFGINGVPLVIRGGGFDPDLFLRYDPADIAKQIGLMKAMGVNTIRLEGHLMPADWYQQMDAAGLLVNAGLQCCDFWEKTSFTAAQNTEYQNTAQNLGTTLRNHPSVFSFQWSDNAPTTNQETLALNGFAAADYTGPFVSSAEYNSSAQLGTSGEKEGPYDWVPPTYWYDTSHFDSGDSTLTNAGGSWGFDSEQSAGHTVPTLDSLNRFMSTSDESTLWQTPGANQFHSNYEGTGHTGYAFGTLFNLDSAITNRYGAPSSLAQYVQEAQVQNYEDTRAQFEAFIDHSTNGTQPATGTIYWQMNKGWPTLLWSLYNNDGDQAGSFFGVQKADKPLHAIYALDDNTVTVDNLGGATQAGVTVESKVYNTAGTVLDDQTSSSMSLSRQQVKNKVITPKIPTSANTVYFVELLVKQGGNVVDRNVYWASTTPDVINWTKTLGQPQATVTSFANMKALQNLPTASVTATASTTSQAGPAGSDKLVTVTVTNNSATPTVGFFLRADVRRGTSSGTELSGDNELQSSIWSDNDTTLWPGESETLTATYSSADLQGATPVVSVSGWNVPKFDVVAGTAGTANDFSLATSPTSGSVTAGSSATTTVSTAVASGNAESVNLSAAGLPAGATASFSPASVTSGNSSTLTVATSASTPAGTYPITVTGTAASGSHTTTYTLTVTAPATNDFSISLSPTSGSITAGTAAATAVNTATISGAAQSIALSASGLPSGATASFSPASVTSGGSSTLTISTSASTPAGTYSITVTGSASSGSHTATYTLTVTSAGGGCTAAQLLANPGFESGSNPAPWTETSTTNANPVNNDTADEPSHSGKWDAWLNGDSTADTDTISQSVTVPTGCAKATLSFWLHIDTTENTTTAKPDTLSVQVLSSSGTVLSTVGTFSNLDANTGYAQHTFDVSSFIGQAVTLRFTGTETDKNGGTTSFVIDDTALNVS